MPRLPSGTPADIDLEYWLKEGIRITPQIINRTAGLFRYAGINHRNRIDCEAFVLGILWETLTVNGTSRYNPEKSPLLNSLLCRVRCRILTQARKRMTRTERLKQQKKGIYSIHNAVRDELQDGGSLFHPVYEHDYTIPETAQTEQIIEAVNQLPIIQQTIIKQAYGLDGQEPVGKRELARRLKMTHRTLYFHLNKGLTTLRYTLKQYNPTEQER